MDRDEYAHQHQAAERHQHRRHPIGGADEYAEPAQSGGDRAEIRPGCAEGDRAFQLNQGAEEPEHHHRAVTGVETGATGREWQA